MIDPGRRDRLITIQRMAAAGRDELNAPVETWQTLVMVYAEKRDLSDRERMAGGEVAAEITTRFRLEWSPTLAGITPKDRVLIEGAIFDIWGVKDVGTREEIEITAARRIDK